MFCLYRYAWLVAVVGMLMVASGITQVRAERGRPIIDPVNKTLVADNGYLLRGCHSHFHAFAYEGAYKNLSWWIALRDNAHLNVVRMMAFLGEWPKSPEIVDEATLAARLDVAVDMAAAAGMYIIIDNHSNCCGYFNWDTFHAFWDVVAPRYKDRTHVIYEAQNEPYYKNATGAGIKAQYDYIRAKAPNTHIILHSIAKIDDIEVKAAQESGIDYANANASIGFHSYLWDGQPYTDPNATWWYDYLYQLMELGPVVMTETCDEAGTQNPDKVIAALEEMKISWQWLAGDDFGTHTGFNPSVYEVHWPADPGCTGGTVMTATPSFSPAPVTYTGSAIVSISCATSGAAIHYTTDGSTPTTSSTQYQEPITITSTSTIKAKAFKSGCDPSNVATAVYTIAVDNTAPSIAAVTACGDPTRVNVTYSEAVDQATAQTAANYTVTGGISVSAATLDSDKRSVVLEVTALAEGTTYTLTVNNVKDLSGNTIAANTTRTFQYTSGWTDDFADGNYTAGQAWTSGEGSWSVVSGQLQNTDTGRTSIYGGQTSWTDLTFTSSVTPLTTGCDVAVLFRVQDANNYLLFTLLGTDNKGALYAVQNGSYSSRLADGNGAVTFSPNTTYTIKVELNGTAVKVYANNILVLNTTNTLWSKGAVGFGSNMSQGRFDNVAVTMSTGMTRAGLLHWAPEHSGLTIPNPLTRARLYTLVQEHDLKVYTLSGSPLGTACLRNNGIYLIGTDRQAVSKIMVVK